MTSTDVLARRRWLVLASTVVSFFAVGVTFFAVPPLVPQLVERFALDHLRVGILMGAIAVPAILLSIPLGAAIDRWPARPTGNLGLLLMAIGGTVFALAPSYPTLLVGRLVFGVGGLALNLLLARLVTTAFAGRELSLAMGIFNSVYPASMIVMFTLHPILLERLGWRGELLLLAGLALAAVPLHNLAVPAAGRGQSGGGERRQARARLTEAVVALAGAWALFFGVYASVLTFAPEWAGGGAGALRTVALIAWTALILAPPVGAVIDRTGRPARWLAGALTALALVLAAMAAGAITPAPAMILVGAAAAVALTATYSLPDRLVPAVHVGFAFGFITAFSNLATLIGPAATGAIRDSVAGWPVPWGVLAVAALVGATVAAGIREGDRGQGSGIRGWGFADHPPGRRRETQSGALCGRAAPDTFGRLPSNPVTGDQTRTCQGWLPRGAPRENRREARTQPLTKSSRGTRGISPAAWARPSSSRTARRPRSP